MQYAIMNSSYATQATVMQCLFLKGYLHVVSDSENKTSMITPNFHVVAFPLAAQVAHCEERPF